MPVATLPSSVRAAARRARARTVGAEIVVFALAAAARLGLVLTSGGLQGNYGYDASVYYAAADGLVHGRLPYRDFVLLHPPGIVLALAPFAWLGRLTTDHTGFVVANLAFTMLGALNAVLVVRIARQLELGRRAALLGGCCYALWFGSVQAEYLARLEPLGNFLLLSGVLAYVSAARSGRARAYLMCGAALGAAASVKIWWSVPLLVMVGGLAVSRRVKREALLAAAGALAALVVINGAFVLAAPGRMWRMVVSEQLGRPHDSHSALTRLASLTGVNRLWPHLHRPALVAVLGAIAVGYVCVAAMAWTVTRARVVVALAAIQLVVLLAAPSWFSFYADYVAPAFALSVAAATGAPAARAVIAARWGQRRTARWAWLPAVAMSSVTVLVFALNRSHAVQRFPGAVLADDVTHVRCVQSDSPMALIELNALSRDLSHGCRVWVDVTGSTYAPGFASYYPDGAPVPRRANGRWQRDLRAYLMSGEATVVIRAAGTGLSPATTAAIQRGGVLATSGDVVVYHTRPPATSNRTTAHARIRQHDRDDDRD